MVKTTANTLFQPHGLELLSQIYDERISARLIEIEKPFIKNLVKTKRDATWYLLHPLSLCGRVNVIKILEHTQRKTVKKIRITSTLPLTKFRDVKKGARDVSLCSKYIASDETKTK